MRHPWRPRCKHPVWLLLLLQLLLRLWRRPQLRNDLLHCQLLQGGSSAQCLLGLLRQAGMLLPLPWLLLRGGLVRQRGGGIALCMPRLAAFPPPPPLPVQAGVGRVAPLPLTRRL